MNKTKGENMFYPNCLEYGRVALTRKQERRCVARGFSPCCTDGSNKQIGA